MGCLWNTSFCRHVSPEAWDQVNCTVSYRNSIRSSPLLSVSLGDKDVNLNKNPMKQQLGHKLVKVFMKTKTSSQVTFQWSIFPTKLHACDTKLAGINLPILECKWRVSNHIHKGFPEMNIQHCFFSIEEHPREQ